MKNKEQQIKDKSRVSNFGEVLTSKREVLDMLNESLGDLVFDKDKDDPELRYLRLLVQLNAPKFLSYDKSIESDLNFFINNILNSDIDIVWVKKFCCNLLSGKYISNTQQIRLNTFLFYINN